MTTEREQAEADTTQTAEAEPAEKSFYDNTPEHSGESEEASSKADEGQPDESPAEPADAEESKPDAEQPYELTTPEGVDAFDSEVLGVFSEVARELELPLEAAQKVLDKVGPAIQARAIERQQQIRTELADAARADKEIGGDKLADTVATAQKALDRFGSDALRSWLDESGAGNHPEIIRAFAAVGRAISEDGFVPGGDPPTETDPAKVMFPYMN